MYSNMTCFMLMKTCFEKPTFLLQKHPVKTHMLMSNFFQAAFAGMLWFGASGGSSCHNGSSNQPTSDAAGGSTSTTVGYGKTGLEMID